MKHKVTIWRDKNGIPHVEADNRTDLAWGIGYVHATDRGMQLLLMRILGQGRVCEILDSSEPSLKIDMFFRKAGWSLDTKKQLDQLTDQHIQSLKAYCDGINSVFRKKCPWDLKLLGYRHEEWEPAHCILLIRMMGYLTLVQSQDEVERLIVELIQGGTPEAYLQELFPGLLEGLDMDLIKQVTLPERIIPPNLQWNLALPGILTGRNRNLSWGVTYAFIDSIDSWNDIFKKIVNEALEITPQKWSEKRQVTLKNILFDGKLPKFFGFDKGPINGIGSRATIHQGQEKLAFK